jgi:flagellar basal-body rod modification protein FlgD
MSTVSNVINSALSSAGTSSSSAASSSSGSSSSSGGDASQQLAGNFDTFLQLLTTQLQNQDPLDPMDTNSFTQELVEFSSVEQQIDMNTNMQTMISLQQASSDVSALQLVGSTATVSGTSATLSNATSSPATWTLNSPSAATAKITITNSSGQTAYTGTTSLNPGTQTYTWSGQGNNGATWPDGTYTIAISATGASNQTVSVGTTVQGVITAVNANANPPTVTVGGQSVPISSIQSLSGSGSSGLTSSLSSLNSNISSLTSSIGSLNQLL